MSKEVEYETIRLKLPKQVVDFLRDYEEPVAYIERSILETVSADIDAGAFDHPIKAFIDGILEKE